MNRRLKKKTIDDQRLLESDMPSDIISKDDEKTTVRHPWDCDNAAYKLWYKEPTIDAEPGTLLWRDPSIARLECLRAIPGCATRRVPLWDPICDRLEELTTPTEYLPMPRDPEEFPFPFVPGDYKQSNIAWPDEEKILLVSSNKLSSSITRELYALKISAGGGVHLYLLYIMFLCNGGVTSSFGSKY